MSDTAAKHIRTPLARVRGLGAARSGTDHFLRQRLTAVANIPLTIAAVVIIMLLFIVSVAVHMRIGMQVVIEDYAQNEIIKLALIMANYFFTIAVALTAAYGLLKLSFGL